MEKQINLPIRLELVRYPEQTVLNVEFQKEALADWCLGLCLLKEGLITVLLVREEAAKGTLEIQLAKPTKPRTRAQASFRPEATLVKLTPHDLDYLLHFFLKYFRDGVAEVDHLDMDVESLSDNQDSTIVFKVPASVPPLSAEAARMRLGVSKRP